MTNVLQRCRDLLKPSSLKLHDGPVLHQSAGYDRCRVLATLIILHHIVERKAFRQQAVGRFGLRWPLLLWPCGHVSIPRCAPPMARWAARKNTTGCSPDWSAARGRLRPPSYHHSGWHCRSRSHRSCLSWCSRQWAGYRSRPPFRRGWRHPWEQEAPW